MGDPYEWEVVKEITDLTPYTTLAYGNGIWLRYDGGWYRASDASFADEQAIAPDSPVAWLTDSEWSAVLTDTEHGARFSHDRFWAGVSGPWSFPDLAFPYSREDQLAYLDNRDFIDYAPFYSFDFVTWHPAMSAGITGFTRGITNDTDSDILFSLASGTSLPLYHAGRWFYADDNSVIGADGPKVFVVSTDDFSQPWEAVAIVQPGDDNPIGSSPGYRTPQGAASLNGNEIVVRYELAEDADASWHFAFGSSPTATGWDTVRAGYRLGSDPTVTEFPDPPYTSEVIWAGGEWLASSAEGYFINTTQRATGAWSEIVPPGTGTVSLPPALTSDAAHQDGVWAFPLLETDESGERFSQMWVGSSLTQLEAVPVDDLPEPTTPYRSAGYAVAEGGEWLVLVADYDSTDTFRFIVTGDGGGWGIALA